MQGWKVSTRLYLIVVLSLAVMGALATMNWINMGRLGQLQDMAHQRAQDAGRLKEIGGLGAELYRIVADTYINRHFDESATKWRDMTAQIDKDMAEAAKMADTPQETADVAAGLKAMLAIRSIYNDKFLPLVKSNGPNEQISELDDQIDKLIDTFDDRLSKVSASMSAEALEANAEFDKTERATRIANVSAVLLCAALLAGVALVVARSITRQLGMEPAEAMDFANRIADGDLSQQLQPQDPHTRSLATALTSMLATLESIVTQVRVGAEGVATASAQIAQGNMDLADRTSQSASALQQTAGTMGHLGEAVKHNVDSAAQANQLARDASGVATEGGEVVRQVVETMTGITDSSRKIADIISVIDGIAFQTNILALNAAVEAARAGEQGRGFAVVASEVRSLAQRSADAAKEIKDLIGASVERVETGSALVGQAGQTMEDIVNSIRRVTDIVGEISTASVDQSHSVNEVARSVSDMDRGTQQNAALVEESAAAADSLRDQAQNLVETVARFKLRNAAHG
jgi:methyl-accepting chemotaxis protein